MRSMSAPSDPPPGFAVWHYDGTSAVRRQALLVADGDRFRLIADGGQGEAHAFADLVARESIAGAAVFGLKRRPGWRIGLPGGIPDALADRLRPPQRYGHAIDQIGLWPAVLVFAVLATITVTLVLRTPAAVARLVPRSYERELGSLMVGDLGSRSCHTPAGSEALRRIVDRIAPGDHDLAVNVVHQNMVNAVTLPGGNIVLFDRLLQEARSPEEVAGVLAHETGHVEHRDGMEALLRSAGLSVLLGGLGGRVGDYTNVLLTTTYSRGAEENADSYAIAALAAAHISPQPLADFFHRLERPGEAGRTGRIIGYLSTHPMSADRARRFTTAAAAHHDDRPILDKDEWQALRDICRDDPTPGRDGFRF